MCDGQATSKHINDISIVRPLMLHKTSKNNFELLAPTSQPVVELSPYPLPSPRLPITYPRNIARLQTEMSATRKANEEGGIKGFLTRAGKSFYAGGMFAKEKAWTAAQYGGRFCFVVATTSIVVLMPLIFEIMREGQMIEADKLQVKELRQQGYSDGQLQELGFPKVALGMAPAVLKSN